MSTNRSPKVGAMIGLTTVIITQFVLNLLGINNKSAGIVATVLLTVGVIFAVTMIKSSTKKVSLSFKIAASAIMLLACILSGAMLIMIKCYPQFEDAHKILAMILVFSAVGSNLLVDIFWIIAGSIYFRNNK